ncbi:uncharacterized protein LOC111875292 isoform X2 [Cryptotermes secundus]|uniref:uncharacterized protein LOC111875292 isoform X2 n=1 Tax=Cryptotermes secundus TaxID=105785 RepID=UPI000CD7D6AF|nr:uncharacterized protein LOC111875292 isoform X2 [Cryptotermes secundus]
MLLSALRKKLQDPAVPRLTWQLSSCPTKGESDNSGYDSDSSATFCSALEPVSDKGLDTITHTSEHQAIHNDQNKEQASSLMETDTQEMDSDHMIFNTTENNYDNLIKVDDNKGSFPNSPIFHDMSADWSHLINSILSNNSTDNNFMTTADTENCQDIPVNTNREAVVASNLTADDALSLCGVQVNSAETHSDSTAIIADSVALSADIFANSSFIMEPKDCGSKNSLVANEKDGVTVKSIQPQTDDEIVEIGKTLFQTLNIVSTDSTSASSSASTNSGKDKTKMYNIHKFQNLASVHRERIDQMGKKLRGRNRFHGKEADSNAKRQGQGKFSSMEKLHSGHQKKTANQRKSESKANSPHNRNKRFRKQREEEKYQICARGGPRITRMQTGSLPAASPSGTASTESNTLSRRPRSLNMKSRIRNRMSDIHQEVRAWLCGWGPPLDEAQAHKLIAEVQGIQKNILSPSQFGECGNLKQHEVEEISQVCEKLLLQLQSALTESSMQKQGTTDLNLECEGHCCYSDVETDASDERFSQVSDYSEILGSEKVSSAALPMTQHRICSETVSENLTSEPSDTAIAFHALHTSGDTCCEGANTSCKTTQQMLAHLSCTAKQNETRISTATKRVNFAPSTRDPRLQSLSYGNHLVKTKTSLTSYICETDTQSTHFSIDPNLQQESSEQITRPLHDRLCDSSNQMQSTDMFSTQSTSDFRQRETGQNVHSQLWSSKNINVLSKSPICPININENKTHDLPDVTGVMCMTISGTTKKQAKNSRFKMNMQASTQSPTDMCSSTLENVLQVNNRTEGHTNQNGRQKESTAVIKNSDDIIASSLNVRKGVDISQSTIKSQTRHKVESRLKSLSNEGSQTTQNISKPTVTSTHRKQVENLQSLSTPQKFRSEQQCSEYSGLTQSLMTQSEEESFIFGIKRIWLHSAPEFVPNCQLPEGFWRNKATPIPEDLLQALENW